MLSQNYQKAEKVYKNLLKRLLPRFKGQIIAVEPTTKKYIVGRDELEVALQARKKFPGKKFGFFRVGYPAVHKVRKIL